MTQPIKKPAGDTLEIVERSSGYWVTNGSDIVEGPFVELEDAIVFRVKRNSEDIYHDLPDTAIESIKLGNWNGVGIALAATDGDKYRHWFWPSESACQEALEFVKATLCESLMYDIAAIQED